MTKLKRNHAKAESSLGGGMITKVGIFTAIIGSLFFFFNRGSGTEADSDKNYTIENNLDEPKSDTDINLSIADNFLPSSTTGEVIKRLNYTLSYSEEHEQAEWVAYKLTKKSIQQSNVERTGDFRPDPKVRKGSASPRDYYNTGYDRGHMAPAGDMNFDKKAMSETFYMSNMSPQIRNFNGGIWRELEESTRDWAYDNNEIYVVTGPVLTQGIREKIGDNGVSVPDLYYKILLDITPPEMKAIAFLMPNEVSDKPLSNYTVSINKIEEITGIDFFYQLLEDDTEEELESMIDISLWEISDKRQQLRVENWNKRK
ncbi:MAG: endonuclease G [Saprospiraceae bacterium]|jgi:endonuclease G